MPKRLISNDYELLGRPVIMYALEGLLESEAAAAYSMVFEALIRLWAKTFIRSELPALKRFVHKALLQAHNCTTENNWRRGIHNQRN